MPTPITSLQNRRVKDAIKLRDRRGREKQGRIIIDGLRELRQALVNGVELLEAFVCPSIGGSDDGDQLVEQLRKEDVEILEVTPPVWDKLTYGSRREGLLAVGLPPSWELDRLPVGDPAFIAILDGIEKPGNVGAIARTADAAGVDAILATNAATDLFNPNAIRASIGTVFCLPMVSVSCDEAFSWLRARELTAYVARVGEGEQYTTADFRNPCAITLGSEDAGLGDEWSGDLVTPVQLPMCGAADSLNVSAAAAVLFYEVLRQRGG